MRASDAGCRSGVAVLLGLSLCVGGCAGAATRSSASGPTEGTFVVDLPASQPQVASLLAAPIDRTKIHGGTYTAHIALESHHGCSMSWASTTVTGTVELEIVGGTARLDLKLDESNMFGSRHSQGVERSTSKLAASWWGAIEANGPGAFKATLESRSCDGECANEPTVTIECEKQRIAVAAPGAMARSAEPTGSMDGLSCKGVATRLSTMAGSLDALPLGRGDGVEVVGSGFGDVIVRTYAKKAELADAAP